MLDGDGIGVYGDSLSWQYSLWVPVSGSLGFPIFSNGHQFNWVDHLVMSGYNLGPLVDLSGQGNFYNAYDIALGGAVSGDLPGQVSQLAPYLTSNEVKLTVVEIGGNNFTVGLGGRYGTIYTKAANVNYNPLNDPAELAFIAQVVSDITSAVNATLALKPNEKIVMMTIPDIGVTPSYRQTYNVAARRADVTAVVNAINEELIEFAATKGIPVVDAFSLSNLVLTQQTLAGVTILTGGGNGGNRMFLSDGFHPGTVLNGILANAVLKANEIGYDDPATYISDQTILTRAGLTSGVPIPSYFDVSPYVIFTPLPEPSTIVLAGISGLCIAVMWGNRRRMPRD